MDYYKTIGYNMRVIRAFWKSFKGSYGDNWIRGNETDTTSLYASVEKSRESIRNIENMEWSVSMDIIDTWAKRIDKKTGISYEYLEGRERIKLGKEFEKKYYKNYEDFIDNYDILRDLLKEKKTDMSGYSLAKIKKIAQGDEYSSEEKELFKREIDIANKAVKKMVDFDNALYEEVKRIKNLDLALLMERDKKLYRLVYFLKTGKQSEASGLITMEDILRVMERTGMEHLGKYKKNELKRYIKALDRHLTFARAVFINCYGQEENI